MKLPNIALVFLALVPSYALLGDSISMVREKAKIDLQSAIKQLAEVRNGIEKEKIPLAKTVTSLEDKARKLRSELQHYLRLRDNREASLLQLEREVTETESELDYSLNLLRTYITGWYHANPSAEKSLWAKKLSTILVQTKNDTTIANSFSSSFDALSLSIEAIRKSAGGILFIGNAIVPPEGIRQEGTFWSTGPTVFFSSKEGTSGFLEKSRANKENQQLNLSSNSVLKITPARLAFGSAETSKSINNAFREYSEEKKTIHLPLDPTMGKALVMEKGEPNILEELQKGGIWIYPILFFAVLSLFIAIFKAIQISRVKLPTSAAALEGKYNGPFELLRKTALGYQGKNHEILEEILYEAIIDMQVKLEKALPLIAVTAATAPLLGLLGTVTGMIDVFRQITNFANPENSELARGISEALVTTKFGLVTAIPSLIAHALLTRRLQGIISKMEGFSARLVRLKQESLDQPSTDTDANSDS